MTDKFSYETPLGLLGTLFDGLILKRYMRRFLTLRNCMIKELRKANPDHRRAT